MELAAEPVVHVSCRYCSLILEFRSEYVTIDSTAAAATLFLSPEPQVKISRVLYGTP